MHLEGTDRCHDHDGRRVQPGRSAFEVEELLAAEIEREPRLGDRVIGQRQRHPGGDDRVAAVGDVGERSAVNEGGHRFRGLHEVGQEGLVKNGGHRADHADLPREHRLAVLREADQDPIKPRSQIGRRVGQAEDGHDLAGRGDVEAALSRYALRTPAQADDDVPQGAIVHVQDPLPEHLGWVELEVAKVDVVIDRRGQQVVGRGDRVKIASELKVDRVRRLDLAQASTGRSALAAEDRPHRRLTQSQGHALADAPQTLGKSDRRGRLSLARGRRRDCRDQDQLARLAVGRGDRLEAYFRLVAAVRLKELLGDVQVARHLYDRSARRLRQCGSCDRAPHALGSSWPSYPEGSIHWSK